MILTQEEINKYQDYLIGKPCPDHPDKVVKASKYGGVWCGAKTFQGYCNCGWPTEQFLTTYRKAHYDNK